MDKPDLAEFLGPENELVDQLRELLRRRKTFKVEALADKLDVPPKRIREALGLLRDAGFRIPDEVAGQVELIKVPPVRDQEAHKLPLALLDGERVRFGVISDTHLCSKECALDELHLAYDHLEREEIADVFHPGDLVAGMGIFKNQHLYVTHHSFEDQRDFAVERYPKRTGITTHIIAGNHDLDGDFGKAGCDPVAGVANKRDDFNYLGPYSAWIELANGGHVHLLHGRGGMSYSFSYRMQKLCEGYAAGRKPEALLLGHFHVQGNLEARGIQGMFPACFEWTSVQFGERLGHRNSVGFHIVDAWLGDDGSIVRWRPEWLPVWEGRSVDG